MILSPALAESAAILAEVPDDTLTLYAPLERAVIVAVKKILKNESECPAGAGQKTGTLQDALNTQ